MAKLNRKKGTTSQILHIFIQDSSSTAGAGLTGLTFESASLACRYINPGGTLSGAITLETISTLGTYATPTSNAHIRFKEVSSASPSQGIYELHIHNDWMNLTGGSVVIMLAGATNMAQTRLEIDLQADANLTSIQGDATSVTDFKDFVDTGYDPTAHKVAGVVLTDTITTYTGNTPQTGDSYVIVNGASGLVAIKNETATILADTNELQTNQGNWLTATGFSTHSAADVWAVATRAITDKAGFVLAVTGLDTITIADGDTITAGTIRDVLRNEKWFIKNKLSYDKATDTMTLYKDNGTTAGIAFAMVDDASEATRGAGV